MSSEFKREERYMVFKVSAVAEHLTATEALHLARLYEIQRVGRKEAGKAELECVVVESDWPEYEPTWKAIEARVTGAQPTANFADAYQGAMEEAAIWKKRALEAEDLNRKFVAEINGPTYMGEPAQPAPSVPDGWKLVPVVSTDEMDSAGSEHCDGYLSTAQAVWDAMLAKAPEAKP